MGADGTYANSLHHHGDPETGWSRRPFELESDEEGRLVFQGVPAIPVGPLVFHREDGLLITFRENESGEIEFMFVNQTVYERLDGGLGPASSSGEASGRNGRLVRSDRPHHLEAGGGELSAAVTIESPALFRPAHD